MANMPGANRASLAIASKSSIQPTSFGTHFGAMSLVDIKGMQLVAWRALAAGPPCWWPVANSASLASTLP